jgi:putative flippase GtrA
LNQFLKAQGSSLISSTVDFLSTFLIKELGFAQPLWTAIFGTICGGVTNFLINRNWVFKSQKRKVIGQIFKYILIWSGNLGLNAFGNWLLLNQTNWHYLVIKILVSLIVGFTYNYFLQKKFVFK